MADISLDIAVNSAARAEAFYRRMDEIGELLAQFPGIGRRHEGFGPGVRAYLVDRRWTVVYDSEAVPLMIHRVLWAGSRIATLA